MSGEAEKLTPQRIGQLKYWEQVRLGQRKAPWELAKENKASRKEELVVGIRHLERMMLDKRSELAEASRCLEAVRPNEQHEALQLISTSLTSKLLLSEQDIARAAGRVEDQCGVYFLVSGMQVVYVGQSVNVHARAMSHYTSLKGGRAFDSVAWIPCREEMLNKLESLYIHYLKPPLNGNDRFTKGKAAPLKLSTLLEAK